MLYQIIGRPDPRDGVRGDQVLLGSVRIDDTSFQRKQGQSMVAFHAFKSSLEEHLVGPSYCAQRDIFLVVYRPRQNSQLQQEGDYRDALFSFRQKTKRNKIFGSTWFLIIVGILKQEQLFLVEKLLLN